VSFKKSGCKSLNWLSTHPATRDRIAELQERLADLRVENPQQLDKDFQSLKQALAHVPAG
jgi:predicted Zn-dependent protease